MSDDYYNILGISRNASQSEISDAYREMARKYHPDLNLDDAAAKEKFQKVQRAHEVLNDAQKRELYDRYGSSFETVNSGGPQPGGGGRSPQGAGEDFDFSQFFGEKYGAGGGGGFSDMFRQFTGGQGGPRQPAKGQDLQTSIDVPFNTAIKGGQAQINVQRAGGKHEPITIKIPAGIESGKTLRLRGQGEQVGGGGQAGDILVTVQVGPHPHYLRRGNNLEVQVPITVAEAAVGAKIDVPTPGGTIALSVPSGSSSGKRLRLKGMGIKPQSGTAGDLFVVLQIVLPEEIDEDSKELIEKFAEANPLDPRIDLQW
jgi:curved DNA-binding protein